MKEMPPGLAEKVWEIAGKVEWTAEDWKDAYHSITALFARIAARHAKAKIEASENRTTAGQTGK